MKKGKNKIEDPEFLTRLKAAFKKLPLNEFGLPNKFFIHHDIVPTGSVMFDIFLDGGFKVGVSRFIGEAEHGKTANALQWSKNWLEHVDNSFVVYIDAEGRLSDELLKKSGINFDENRFFRYRNNIYEEVTDLIDGIIRVEEDAETQSRFLFVIDSLDALIARGDFEKGMSEHTKVASGALLSSVFLKKVSLRMGARGHHLMYLSQVRTAMNSGKGGGMGATFKAPSGGKALEFYSSWVVNIRKNFPSNYIYENRNDKDSKRVGRYFILDFLKTPHEKTGEVIKIPIKNNHGVWHEQECFDLMRMYGFLTKGGAWYEISDAIVDLVEGEGETIPKKMQGEKKIVDFLENNSKITWIVLDYIKELCISTGEASSVLFPKDDSKVLSSDNDE